MPLSLRSSPLLRSSLQSPSPLPSRLCPRHFVVSWITVFLIHVRLYFLCCPRQLSCPQDHTVTILPLIRCFRSKIMSRSNTLPLRMAVGCQTAHEARSEWMGTDRRHWWATCVCTFCKTPLDATTPEGCIQHDARSECHKVRLLVLITAPPCKRHSMSKGPSAEKEPGRGEPRVVAAR